MPIYIRGATFKIFIIQIALLSIVNTQTKQTRYDAKPTLALFTFEGNGMNDEDVALYTGYLNLELHQTKSFILVEKIQINELLREKEYDKIPGTIVFDADKSREGYHLNQFCISLRLQKNRDAFNKNEEAYLDAYPMSKEQREAVLKREWNLLLELGGNIYYTSKLAANDGINFQNLAGRMTGMGVDSYRKMMLKGGRSIEGNRDKSEWGED